MKRLTCNASLCAGLMLFSTLFISYSAEADSSTAEDTAYYLCSGCHGNKNQRVELMTPNIIGQKKTYLAKQLRHYRVKERIHPDMNGVMESFSDAEIDALAGYFSSLGKTVPSTGRQH